MTFCLIDQGLSQIELENLEVLETKVDLQTFWKL